MARTRHKLGLRGERGFSLVEVLVSMFIIAIGLLGMAKMQALAIIDTSIARTRSLAAIEAASLASAMHANKAYWAIGAAPASFTVAGTTVSDSGLNGQTTKCDTTTCTAVQMAGFDIKAWGANLQTQFPTGAGAVTCTATVPVTCTIQISWTEKYVAMNTGTSPTAATGTQTYQLVVEP